eukprot:CAMPEP_0197652358 /NCGR_PEP_ID=MMETSP1338-20131121/34405_1 /TAXON_ID=43686 ORGANISM="Pelagodinium beii, Strain RCC1491" /NCGR_SAMPLE_ID=MMETSP1338 /ASSEMBLY_ACC=CAM_ASM_000754 /LENGTH=230 /DNA_ID=CAMNT_0043227221 /DNA_START=31 /DNA_END=723 /DNA_ORIENTATION=-
MALAMRFGQRRSTGQLLGIAVAFGVAWTQFRGLETSFVSGLRTLPGLDVATTVDRGFGGIPSEQRVFAVVRHAAKKKKSSEETIMHGDTVYIKVMTGRYIGELDGTTKLEWVKARGTKKDKEHALTIQKLGDQESPIESGDTVMLVMPTGVHVDVLGSAVRARHYDPRGQWQRLTIVKQDGGPVFVGDKIFLRGHQGEYMDANPLERAPDGEVKARWRDEGEWQEMWIEK